MRSRMSATPTSSGSPPLPEAVERLRHASAEVTASVDEVVRDGKVRDPLREAVLCEITLGASLGVAGIEFTGVPLFKQSLVVDDSLVYRGPGLVNPNRGV